MSKLGTQSAFTLALIFPGAFLLQQVITTGQTGTTTDIAPLESDIVHIPSGEFIMGSSYQDISKALSLCNVLSRPICQREDLRAETPPHRVRLSSYSIGRKEVSNAEYRRCVRLGACSPRINHHPDKRFDADHLPVVNVTYNDAQSYCQFKGGRLPTEAEWERAARGPLRQQFPWGKLWNGALCNHGRPGTKVLYKFNPFGPEYDDSDGFRFTAPVDSFPASRSPYGLLNVSGNVWEWVADWFEQDYYHTSPSSNPQGPKTGQFRVIRGGSWASPSYAVRTSFRGVTIGKNNSVDLGFRCAWDR